MSFGLGPVRLSGKVPGTGRRQRRVRKRKTAAQLKRRRWFKILFKPGGPL